MYKAIFGFIFQIVGLVIVGVNSSWLVSVGLSIYLIGHKLENQ